MSDAPDVSRRYEAFRVEAAGDRWNGELCRAHRPADLAETVAHLIDPAASVETLHWGRNLLFRSRMQTVDGPVDVVVKQFRNRGTRKRLERRVRGSKAARSWRMARAFHDAGIATAEPVLWIESGRPDGPSFFVTRYLPERMEARFVFRALNQGRLEEEFPDLDMGRFLEAIAVALRQMHEAGFFHRDLSIGNVLLPRGMARGEGPPRAEDLAIIDLNRARRPGAGPSLWQRSRDLARLEIFDHGLRRRFVDAYWKPEDGAGVLRHAAYLAAHWGFFTKIRTKKAVRAPFKRFANWVRPRQAHAHIPKAPDDAGARDKIVWDHLSDQPHQHAGSLEKLRVRLADLPAHLHHHAAFLCATPRIAGRYRRLRAELYSRPVPWRGAGVCVRPASDLHARNDAAARRRQDEQLALIDQLGVRHVLLRLHPWQEHHDAEEQLARELAERGLDIAFALPQNRDLVRDPDLWRRRVDHLAERFLPFGRAFQVGQAINRSKWGVWVHGEYLRLARDAAEILRRRGDALGVEAEVLGPAVIDFEVHATAAVLAMKDCPRFDAIASLLYVDRRGAPENPQLGFDSVGKVLLVQAIADTARAVARDDAGRARSWVTEVNWPLWEGPHSPAGKSVSVDEETQADYLARFYLLALTTGACERVYWWQLVARGYGLVAPAGDDGQPMRVRPAFRALATLETQLRARTFLGPWVPSTASAAVGDGAGSDGIYLLRFSAPAVDPSTAEPDRAPGEGELVAAWSVHGACTVPLPRAPRTVVQQGGERDREPSAPSARLSTSVRYLHF